MKKASLIVGLCLSLPCFAGPSSFNEVWDVVKTPDAHNMVYGDNLPARRTTYADLMRAPYTIFESAKQIMEDTGDLYPENKKKLIRYNGICLAGQWKVNAETPYTGYFAKGAEGLIIARASVGFDETTRGEYRSFGMAGKIFPTTNPDEKVTSAHFFLIDDNAGTKRAHYTTAPLLSEAKLSVMNIIASTLRDFSMELIRTLKKVEKAQEAADQESKIRQLYPISRAGLSDISKAKSPALLKVVGVPGQARVDRNDFRDELRVENYPTKDGAHELKFHIYVAENREKPEWQGPIGEINFTEDAVSDACDMRLRFVHPWWDPNAK